MVKRVGLTMRVAEAAGYKESRDCLAQDWYPFMAYALPEVVWILIPNIGDGVVDCIQRWNLDGFILTGGNDIGDSIIRDKTERTLLDYATSNQLPVFGVCRGLQMIQHYYQGPLSECSRKAHVATTHLVHFINSPRDCVKTGTQKQVNSYHTQAVSSEHLVPALKAMAITEDGWVEGLFSPNEQIVAVQWHPERNRPSADFDRDLIRAVFKLKN